MDILFTTQFSQHHTGALLAMIASAMSSLSPILIVPLTAWRYKLQLNRPALIAMLIAAGGVMLIFYK